MNKTVLTSFTILCLLFTVFLMGLTFNIQSVRASGTIYIRADGSIDPPTANITSADNITYTFTGNSFDSLVIERDNIVVDGAKYAIQGAGNAIELSFRNNVTIMNTTIKKSSIGISVMYSNNTEIKGNNISSCTFYGIHFSHSYNSNVIENNVSNSRSGIFLNFASNNFLRSNRMTNNSFNFGAFFGFNSVLDCINDVDTSNLVDGKPIYYLVNQSDIKLPLDAGCVYLINCSNMKVENLSLKNNEGNNARIYDKLKSN